MIHVEQRGRKLSKIDDFDKFYDNLSPREKEQLILHILSNRLNISFEGYDAGSTVQLLTEGFDAGATVRINDPARCKLCGK